MSGPIADSVAVASPDLVLRALLDALAADGELSWQPWTPLQGAVGRLAIVDVDPPGEIALIARARGILGDAAGLLAVGRLSAEAVGKALKAGADDVLSRPLTSEGLLARLTVLSRRSASSAPLEVGGSDQDFRNVLESLSYPVIVIHDLNHRYVNPAAARLLGYGDASELIGKPVSSVVHPDEVDDATERLRGAQSGERTPGGTERRVLRADGETITLALTPLRRIVFDGHPAVVVAARDVTEERSVETRLRLADRLTSVGTLAAGVAHEVNNPLASVVANVSVLREMLDELTVDRPADEREELLDIVNDARLGADRVEQIVRDLSTFAKVDATTVGPVDIVHSIEATLNIAAPQIRHRAKVVTDFQPVPPVVGNEARIGQVFLHLILNAAQAMPSGRAATNELRVRTQTEGARLVVIEVEDTGRGIAADVRERIFEPFFTTKPVGEGIGLGLSITHSIVEQMGGAIEVTSEVGSGTCFIVKLPAATTPRRRTPEQMRLQRTLTPAEILVVDDEPMITKSLSRLLKGHNVVVAHSGRQALERLAAQSFDLVVCDLIMPDLTGIDVYEELRVMRPGDEERIVFVTGGAFTHETSNFLDNVPNIWIEKPFDLKAVRALLELELGRR